MLDFVICDDNEVFSLEVKGIVEQVMSSNKITGEVTIYNDYNVHFINFMKNNKKKLVYILDVEMPSESGVDVARMIRKTDKRSIIIFVTSHQESANTLIKARLNILTFIYKYDDYINNLKLALMDSIDYSDMKPPLLLEDFGCEYNLQLNDIFYITKDDRKSVIVTAERKYSIYCSLTAIKEKLPSYFKYSHRACIVNTSKIQLLDLNRKIINFDNGMTIDLVSDKYKKELIKR